jgi:hypothetical protein
MAEPSTATPFAPSRPNQRRSRRQSAKSSTKVRAYKNTLGLGKNIAVTVLDVSEAGVRLVLKEDLPIGHDFEVNLESVCYRPVKITAQVVWCMALADGNFVVGARFHKSITWTDLAALARP